MGKGLLVQGGGGGTSSDDLKMCIRDRDSLGDKDKIDKINALVAAINNLFSDDGKDATEAFDKLWNDSSFSSATVSYTHLKGF